MKIQKAKWFAVGTLALLIVGGFLFWRTPPTHAIGSFIGYWKFDESNPGDAAVDESGNDNNLTAVNDPQPSTDRPSELGTGFADPYSISLNGSGQYFYINDNAYLDSTASGVTIALWVKFNEVSGTYQSIASKWHIGVQQQWTLQLNANNKIGWWTGNGGAVVDNLESTSTMESDTWYHIIVTSQGLSKKIYINGELEGSTTSSVAMGTAAGVGVGIGAKTVGSPEYLNGLIDDVRIYSYAISDSEASQLADGTDVSPDTTAPTTSGAPTATSPTTDNTPTIDWTASSDDGSGLKNPAYILEWSTSETFTSVAGSTTTNDISLAPPTGLTDGIWYFRVKATDNSGNIATSAISSPIIIDTTGPTTPGIPIVSTESSDNTPIWNWSASIDNGVGLAFIAYAVEWSQDTSFFGLGGQAGTTENSYTIPDSLSMTDSTWYFRAKAIDVLGNESAWSDYGTVHIDTVAPVISDVVAASGVSAMQRIITWTTDKDASSKVSYGTSSSLGINTSEINISPRVQNHTVTLDNLDPCTTYYFAVISKDEAGNIATSDDKSFTTLGCIKAIDTSSDTNTPTTATDVENYVDNSGQVSQADDSTNEQNKPALNSDDGASQTDTDVRTDTPKDGGGNNNTSLNFGWWLVALLPIIVFIWWLVAIRRKRR